MVPILSVYTLIIAATIYVVMLLSWRKFAKTDVGYFRAAAIVFLIVLAIFVFLFSALYGVLLDSTRGLPQ
ncbi:protein of unknown function (plasmid) [Shinella sp. WSC3-e]|nr:protein of unknown function [Shinella sp. WSC3-e]